MQANQCCIRLDTAPGSVAAAVRLIASKSVLHLQFSAVSDLMHLAPLRLLQVAERGGGWRNGEGGGGVNESCRQTQQSLSRALVEP